MATYSDNATLREARRDYFEANDFGSDGGYGEKWVKFKLAKMPVAFPNFAARVRAVKVHDLHHVITGYETDLVGEGAISAYEIAAGCGDYVAAWMLNLIGMGWGGLIAPRVTLRAFARGRRSKSLYHSEVDDRVLGRTVGDVRAELQVPLPDVTPTIREGVAFAGWVTIAWAFLLSMGAVVLVPWALLAIVLL